jgi:methyltransferase-like protein
MAFLGGEEGAALCIALLCTIVLRRRLSSKKRSTWARKWLRRRRQRSIYSNLVQELREEDPDEYLKYLRMTTTTFNILLEKVRPYIEKKNTVMRNSISAAERLTVTLRFPSHR